MNEEKPQDFIKPQGHEKIQKDDKTNPFEKYQHTFRSNFGTLFLGALLGMIGFVLLGYSEGIYKDLTMVKRVPLVHVDNLAKTSGMVKLTGIPSPECNINVPDCDENLIYYQTIYEEKRDGEWVEVRKDEAWANFSLGTIEVYPEFANIYMNLSEKGRVEEENTRETTFGVENTEELITLGELKDGRINSGNAFIITNKSEKELIDDLSDVGTWKWWLYKLGALVLLTLGITAFFLPIISFLDIFPGFGWAVTIALFLISIIISTLLVFLTTIVITFWWLIIVLVAMLLILLIRIKGTKKKKPINFVP
jgi:hypothetical protein